SDLNLQHRPLNAYVTANAVHVKSANRSTTVRQTKIPYTEAFPPFLIKNRGTVILLAKDTSILFAGRPSLYQMIAASGHRTIVPHVDLPNLEQFIHQAETHHNVLIVFPSTSSTFPSNLEGVVLIDPGVDSDIPPPATPTVLLYTDNKTADQGEGEEWSNTRTETVTYRTRDMVDSSKAREKFGQIIANFLDRIHSR
ncbi:hypothetical protein PFISCL1PPCAC_29002, partial [Pristionchus fissidentatus]